MRYQEPNLAVAPRDGFEPSTNRLTAGCSTAELPGSRGARTTPVSPITKGPSIAKDEIRHRNGASGTAGGHARN